jgi:octaprenyl-diphosphate synthase
MYDMNELRYFDKYIDKINCALEKELELYSWSEFYEPLRYACSNGKRLRPLMLILSAESIGNYNDNVYLAAIAIELLHTESIIHDDIIDNEINRRGKIPFYRKYGYNFSMLTADFVLGIILNIIAKIGNVEVAKELSKAALYMSEGEAVEIKVSNSITLDDYIKILEYKTASLFEISTKIGAILANGSKEEIEALSKFGRYIGIAYQIQDDIKDWENEERTFNVLSYSTLTKHFLDDMYDLYIKYLNTAEDSLSIIKNKFNLARFIDLTKNELKLDR